MEHLRVFESSSTYWKDSGKGFFKMQRSSKIEKNWGNGMKCWSDGLTVPPSPILRPCLPRPSFAPKASLFFISPKTPGTMQRIERYSNAFFAFREVRSYALIAQLIYYAYCHHIFSPNNSISTMQTNWLSEWLVWNEAWGKWIYDSKNKHNKTKRARLVLWDVGERYLYHKVESQLTKEHDNGLGTFKSGSFRQSKQCRPPPWLE